MKVRSFEELRSIRGYTAATLRYVPPPFKRPKKSKGRLSLCVTGGLGDLFVAMPLIDAIRREISPVNVYTSFPEVYEMLGGKDLKKGKFPGYDVWLGVNTLPRFRFEDNFQNFPTPAAGRAYMTWRSYESNTKWHRVISWHPGLDNETGRLALEEGWTRASTPFHLLGLAPPEKPYRVSLDPVVDWIGPFITVHDGFDVTQPIVKRATKTWSLESWAMFIRAFKKKFPDYKVIQLGGLTSRQIEGVDVDLVGKVKLGAALRYLGASKLHVDGDSGLTHAATAFGIPTIAMFGPTPAKFFGYPQNVNLTAGSCGDCWWLTEDWLRKCPVGYPTPVCMDRISPLTVFTEAKRILGDHDG